MFERSSQDLGSNLFGTEFINLCSAFQCLILNGIKTFGFDDSETYVPQAGSSTIDYFIASNDLCKQELLESIVVDGNCVESDHLPVLSTLQLSPRAPKMKHETKEARWVEQIVWDKDKVPEFLEIYTSTAVQAEITHSRAIVSTDISLAIDTFVECLKKASVCLVGGIKVGRARQSTEWFDQDCFIHRKQCRAKLRRYRQTRCAEDRENYVKSRGAYGKLLAEQNIENKITKDQWLEHFMTVFNSGNNDVESDVEKWGKSNVQHLPHIESLD